MSGSVGPCCVGQKTPIAGGNGTLVERHLTCSNLTFVSRVTHPKEVKVIYSLARHHGDQLHLADEGNLGRSQTGCVIKGHCMPASPAVLSGSSLLGISSNIEYQNF